MSTHVKALLLLMAALLVGITSFHLAKLREQQSALSKSVRELDSLRALLDEAEIRLAQSESNRGAALNETLALRGALQALEGQKAQREQLTRENDLLRKDLKSLQNKTTRETESSVSSSPAPRLPLNPVRPKDIPNPTLKDKLEANICASHLHQIALAASWWANNHEDHAPMDLSSLRAFLGPMILVCPSDTPQSLSAGWDKFDPKMISYRIGYPGMLWHGPTHPFVTCPLHETSGWNFSPAGSSIPSKLAY